MGLEAFEMRRKWTYELIGACLVLVVAVIAMSALFAEHAYAVNNSVKYVDVTGKVKSAHEIKVSWPKTKAKVTKYRIYRSNTGKKYGFDTYPLKYKRIKTLKGSKYSFTDKKVKTGRIYSYKVNGY